MKKIISRSVTRNLKQVCTRYIREYVQEKFLSSPKLVSSSNVYFFNRGFRI